MSIPLPILASNQITLVEVEDATDAYSVFLTSESYTFIGNTTGAPSGLSCTTQALAYYGAQQCSKVNISTVTCPTGISAAITDNNTVSPTITFSTTDTITQACEATIPVVVDGVIINKKFSFAVAKQGGTGLDGKGIKSTTITYQTASSGAIAPTGAWSETIPSTDPSKPYLWTRTAVTYTDDTTSTSYSVSSTLEGVSVGGRNLILDTKTMRKWTKGSKLTVTYSVADERGGTDAVKIVNSEGTVGEAFFNHPLPSSVSLESSTYTLSFWSKSDASTGSAIQINSDGFTNAKTISINDIWKRYVYSFTTNSVYTGTEVLWFNILGASPIYIAHVKLELGNIATDWTPAPEDQESDVTSKIEQLKDSISLSVTDGAAGKTAKIKLGIDDETKEASIDLTGVVTFSDLSTAGSTTINGSNITTGALSADLITTGTLSSDRIDTSTLFAKDITATGKIQFNNGCYKFAIDETNKQIKLDSWSELLLEGTPVKIHSPLGYIILSTSGMIELEANQGVNITGDLTVGNKKLESGTWTPVMDGATVTNYGRQDGWYLRFGEIVVIGWDMYFNFANTDQHSTVFKIKGVPYIPSKSANGGGSCFGYYAHDTYTFIGWGIDESGVISGNAVPNGGAGIKYVGDIYCGNNNDAYSSGTIIYKTSTT